MEDKDACKPSAKPSIRQTDHALFDQYPDDSEQYLSTLSEEGDSTSPQATKPKRVTRVSQRKRGKQKNGVKPPVKKNYMNNII